MTQQKVTEIAAQMAKEGLTPDQIKAALFNTKGVKIGQIKKALQHIAGA